MLNKSYPARMEFTVLIDKELLGRINHLSYRIEDSRDGKLRNDKSFSDEFVSGRFRFTDLNYYLISKLCGLDRFSTILTDGERVFARDSNGLQNIQYKIEFPLGTSYNLDEIPYIEDIKGLFSVPHSIFGVKIVNLEDASLAIGKQYNFTAKSMLFLAEHADNLFQLSLR